MSVCDLSFITAIILWKMSLDFREASVTMSVERTDLYLFIYFLCCIVQSTHCANHNNNKLFN